jgi:N-acylglucosamine-6-phosphate 2-epimerase
MLSSVLFSQLQGKLIVSCQAYTGEPLFGADHMAAMALSAKQGGAAGIRANSPVDIRAIKAAVDLPVIGLYKIDLPGYAVRITPTLDSAFEVAGAGADIIALDATLRPHPDSYSLEERVRQLHAQTGKAVMADIATYEEGLVAEAAGVDLISTTLSGYTDESPQQEAPDLALVERLATRLRIPLIAEGRIATPFDAKQALACGAFAVVVGAAITRPQWITQQFIKGMLS